jgi:hypothetical protein
MHTFFQVAFSSLYEIVSPFTRDFDALKLKLQQLEEYDKTCIETALHGVNRLVLGEWGSATPCQVRVYEDYTHLTTLSVLNEGFHAGISAFVIKSFPRCGTGHTERGHPYRGTRYPPERFCCCHINSGTYILRHQLSRPKVLLLQHCLLLIKYSSLFLWLKRVRAASHFMYISTYIKLYCHVTMNVQRSVL